MIVSKDFNLLSANTPIKLIATCEERSDAGFLDYEIAGLTILSGSGSAKFSLSGARPRIPSDLLVFSENRIKTDKEITQDLRATYNALRARLADLSVDSTQEFFHLPATARLTARAHIELPRLPPLKVRRGATARRVQSGPPTIRVTGEIALATPAKSLTGAFRFDIAVDVGAPGPTLEWGLAWSSFALRHPTAALPLSFPTLSLAGLKLDLRTSLDGWLAGTTIFWATPPVLRLDVDSVTGIGLAIDDGTPAAGPAIGTLNVNAAPLLNITSLKISGPIENLDVALEVAATAAYSIPDGAFLAGPFNIGWTGVTVDASTAGAELTIVTQVSAFWVQAAADAATRIAVSFNVRSAQNLSTGASTRTLEDLTLIDPNPGALLSAAIRDVGGLLRIAIPIRIQVNADPLMDRLTLLLRAALKWLGSGAGSAADFLVGLASAAGKAIDAILDVLRKLEGALPSDLVIELRWDSAKRSLRQIIISRAGSDFAPDPIKAGELTLTLPGISKLMLVFDLDQHWAAVAAMPSAGQPAQFELATDLWLGGDKGTSALRGQTNEEPLIRVTATVEPPVSGVEPVALVLLRDGRASFFERLGAGELQTLLAGPPAVLSVGAPLVPNGTHAKIDLDLKLNKDGLTSLFPSGSGAASPSNPLTPTVRIKDCQTSDGAVPGVKQIMLTLEVEPNIGSDRQTIEVKLDAEFDIKSFALRFRDAEIPVEAPKDMNTLGMSLAFQSPHTKPFMLRLGDAPSICLRDQSKAILTFDRIGSDTEKLSFVAEGPQGFCVGSSGLDLDARVQPNPVRLPGLETAFHFDSGQVRLERGKLLAASISGDGELPRNLLGEARIKAAIQLGRSSESSPLKVISATALLDKSGDPLRCEGTRFSFEITHVGLRFKEINDRPHFYGELTGSATFSPGAGEKQLNTGLVGKLPNIRINLDRAPISGDSKALAKAINFQVPIEPPARTKLFGLFEFELRGIGFHPAYDGWSDTPPALALSGQARFTETFDVVQPSFEFHKLWIAPPDGNSSLPRFRMDGLGVGLRIAGMGEFEASAIAVDGQLPSLYAPAVLPADITANGFLASGKLALKGWAPMSGAAGFLELGRKDADGAVRDKKLSLFVFAQQECLAEPIPTPVGTLYLREVGFGFGFRYTLAGLAQTDNVTDPRQLIDVLDPLSRQQGDLAKFTAWQPETEGDRLTLAMRALFTVTTASSPTVYDEKQEKELPNPILFDVVAALRSDLTFLLSARAWIAVNYADWRTDSKDWREKPLLRGYVYISAPKQTFLGRLLSDPEGHVGQHPKLPEPLTKALKQVKFSSTLYVTPGLFHQEFGWPYELEVDLSGSSKNFGAKLNGGLILRIEDGAVLQGIAFKASGFIDVGGRIGGRVGASAQAHATFDLSGKFIAYVSVVRPSDTLFYGRLSLALSLALSIQFWINTKFFSVSAGWSERIDVDIDLEIAVGPTGLGARARASISVHRFGRGLRLGIGATIGGGKLEEARGRVERFMHLGLGATIPNPETGLTPLPEPARQPRATAGDEALERLADQRDATVPPLDPGSPPPPDEIAVGQPITGCDFWAILFPVKGDDRQIVLQLVPRDDEDLPRSLFGSADEGDFFVSPFPARDAGDHLYSGHAYHVTGDQEALDLLDIKNNLSRPQWCQQVDHRSGTTIADLVSGGFLGVDPATNAFTQPPANDPNPDANADAKGCLDTRGALIGHVCDLASQYAESLSSGRPFTGDIDPHWFGLTFVFKARTRGETIDDLINILFEPETDFDSPRVAKFTFAKSDVAVPAQPREAQHRIELLNPPVRWFERAQPRFADAVAKACGGAIRLNWDLEPTWHVSNSRYSDPDTHVRHYAVHRHIRVDNTVQFPLSWQSKSAQVMRPEESASACRDDPFQVMDRLDDLPDLLRQHFLRQIKPGGRKEKPSASSEPNSEAQRGAIERAWGIAFGGASSGVPDSVELVYLVTPIDNGGTVADPSQAITCAIPSPIKAREAPLRSFGLTFVYDEFSSQTSPYPGKLRVDLPAYAEVINRTDPVNGARKELTLPLKFDLSIDRDEGERSGLYGADPLDAERHLRNQPLAGSDADLVIEDGLAGPGLLDVDIYFADRPKHRLSYKCRTKDLFDRLVSTNGQIGSSQIFARIHGGDPGRVANWTRCDIQIEIATQQGKFENLPPLLAPVAEFELPQIIDQERLLDRRSIGAEQGRLWRALPKVDEVLTAGIPMLDSELDPEERSAIRLRWQARPEILADGATIDPDLIGGFDLFMASRDREPPLEGASLDAADLCRLARPLGRVSVKPRSLLMSEPAYIEDFSKLEVSYPTARARSHGRSWFSTAETRLIWPAMTPKKSIMLVPDEGLIGELFARGRPTSIELRIAAEDYTTLELLIDPQAKADFGTLSGRLAEGWQKFHPGGEPPLKLTPAAIRKLLQNLIWSPGEGEHKLTPTIGSLEIRYMTSRLKDEIVIPLNFVSELHPLLADVIDFLRYGKDAFDDGKGYRRYEPVLEGAPAPQPGTVAGKSGLSVDGKEDQKPDITKRPGFAQLLSDTAPERDRAGWAALRQLGLAVGLRLWDTETQDWADTDEHWYALFLWAWERSIQRNGNDHIRGGAPFFEQFFDPEELYDVAGEDLLGKPRAVARRGTPLVQISIRPIADRLRDDDRGKRVHYLKITPRSGARLKAALMTAKFGEGGAFVEILERRGAQTSPSVWVGEDLDANGQPMPQNKAFDAVGEYSFDIAGASEVAEPRTILARLVLPVGYATSGQTAAWALEDCIEAPPPIIDLTLLPQVDPLDWTPLDSNEPTINPYRVFSPLPAELLRRIELAEGNGHQQLLRLADRRFSPPADRESADLALNLQRWERRFIEQGLASVKKVGTVGYATATFDAPASLRRAPDERGEISILYFDKSRLGSWRRFYVRPFGRYDHMAIASKWREDRRSRLDPIDFGNDLTEAPWVDAALARTQPVAKPVLLAAERHPDRNALIVISAISDEEILASATIAQAGARQIAPTAIGWTHALSPNNSLWRDRLLGTSGDILPQLDAKPQPMLKLDWMRDWLAHQALAPEQRRQRPGGTRDEGGLPDLWRGANVWVAHDLPYFFDYSARMFASAGVAVSDETLIALPAPRARPDADWPEEPSWRLENGEFVLTLPLLRFSDCMDRDSRAVWYPNSAGTAKAMFDLPDPQIIYRVFTHNADRQVRTPEFDIEANPADGELKVAMIGPAFKFVSISKPASGQHWATEIRLAPQAFDLEAPPAMEVIPVRHTAQMPPQEIVAI